MNGGNEELKIQTLGSELFPKEETKHPLFVFASLPLGFTPHRQSHNSGTGRHRLLS